MPRRLISLALAAGFALAATPGAQADRFTCPRRGGDFVFAQPASIASLDPMASPLAATRNVALNIYESLMTRDESNAPILDLAQAMHESSDHLTYRFTLRSGVRFHNGQPLTAADVAASFDRYARIGFQRSILANVARWDAPDAVTFVIHMRRPQPTFLEALSAYVAPIVIMPQADRDTPADAISRPIGTGPFAWADTELGAQVRLRRYAGYQPNRSFDTRTGLGGYKQACLDTVTFRSEPDAAARIDGLQHGRFQMIYDIPTRSWPDLQHEAGIVPLQLPDWWLQIAIPNLRAPPTDNLLVRQAIQSALDMDEIMRAADGRTQPGFLPPGDPDHSDAGTQTYNRHDAVLARRQLAEAGYQGEPIVLLASRDHPSLYNAALAAQQQLQAVGMNARMKVVDWATAIRMATTTTEGWNLDFTAWGTAPALGAEAAMRRLIEPNVLYESPKPAQDADLLAAWQDLLTQPTAHGRRDAFAHMQRIALERVYALPLGTVNLLAAMRANVHGFAPFRVARLANVWLQE